jgi:hypothetical protein
VLTLFLVGFSLSISVTIFITYRIAYLCEKGKARNAIIFVAMLFVNYLLLGFWHHITSTLRTVIQILIVLRFTILSPQNIQIFTYYLEDGVKSGIDSLIHPIYLLDDLLRTSTVDNFALDCLSLFSNILRIVISIIFVGSFLVKPLVMRPVNLIWRRIVESDKPVFTLTFGGAAAFASAISEAAKYL